jgi:hypothetical protein
MGSRLICFNVSAFCDAGKSLMAWPGTTMNAASGVTTMFIVPPGVCISAWRRSGKTMTVSICMGKSPCGVFWVMVSCAFNALTAASFSSPPNAATTFAARALPSSLDSGWDSGSLAVLSSLAPGGGGMVMSSSFTGPSDERGLSNSFVLPTTSTAS